MISGRPWPIRARMTVMTSAIAALVCIAVGALILVGVRGRVSDYERERTVGAALRTVHLIKRERLPSVLPPHDAQAVQVLNARGRVVAASANLTGKPPMASFRPTEESVYASRTLCPPVGMAGCMAVVSFRVYQSDGDWTVYAADRTIPWYVSPAFIALLAGGALLLVLVTAAGTARTVSRTLAPVEAIRAELKEISATEAGRRVPVPRERDEIRSLAETANATLDRLDAALARLRRFTSDASHDLRSPITAMRAQVEEALLHPEDADWPRTAEAMLESLERLQAIVSDLLELARLDAGDEGAREPVDLAGLVAEELERRPRGTPVETRLPAGVIAVGDRLRLARLLTNLLDNAERHAASRIAVTVRRDGPRAVLEVLDDGGGIPPEHRETVFQRFARLDAARNRDAGGTGLGLSIARQVAEQHGGTLGIEESDAGARFVLRLPAAADGRAERVE